MGWLIVLGILAVILLLPLGFSVCYDADGSRLRVLLGPVKLQVYPAKKKDKKEKPEKQKKVSSKVKKTGEKTEKNTQTAKKKGGPITDFIPLARLALEFLSAFRRKLRVNLIRLDLVLAGGDPCDLAMNYGKAWAALGNLWPRLEEFLVIRKRDVNIRCDFEGDQTVVSGQLDVTVNLARLLSVGVPYGFKAVKELIKITNKRKGGAAT